MEAAMTEGRDRRRVKRAERLAEVERQIADGSLKVRFATPAELEELRLARARRLGNLRMTKRIRHEG
jgi:hypothetical protein